MYEFSITGALAFSGAYLLALRKYDLRWLGLLVSVSVLLTLGTAITVLYVPSAPLVPALKSEWLVIHVSTAIISGGVFLLSNVIASAYLYLDRMEKKGERTPWAKRLPELEKVLGDVTGAGIQRKLGHLLHGLHMRHIYMPV
jgi:ABC-type transport system involved in cytochrome c biogenesis permease subunit